MKRQRVVLIGATRNPYLKRAAIELKNLGAEVCLLVKDERVNQLGDEVACAGSFHGDITWHSLSLLRTIRALHPNIVAFVVGNQFHHENVSQALRFWKRIGALPGADIYASLSYDPANLEYWGESDNIRFPVTRSTRSGSKDEDGIEQWRRLCLPSLTEDPKCGWKPRHVDLAAWVTRPAGADYSWVLKIDRSGARSTCAGNVKGGAGPQIFLFGGDQTFGVGLSDEETFAWRLQALLPAARVRNYGIEGYDLDQIALALPELMADESPDLVFVELSPAVWGESASASHSLDTIITFLSRLGIRVIFACFEETSKAALKMAKRQNVQILSVPANRTVETAGRALHQESIARVLAEAIEKKEVAPSIQLLKKESTTVEPSAAENGASLVELKRRPTSERFHIINYVWGESFTRLFLDVTLPNHCTEGNLFAFSDHSEAKYKVYTTSRDAKVIRSHHLFREIEQRMPTEVIAFDHLFAPGWEQLDNSLLLMTQMHRVAVNAAYRDDARLVILPPDQVYSDGAFRRVLEHSRQGRRVVVCAGVRVVKESFVPAFKKRFKQADGASTAPARELVRLALDHLHPIIKAEFHDADPFSTGPVNLYHKVGDEGYVTHNLHMHVLMIYPRKPVPLKEGNFDTSWMAATCPRFDDYYIVDDSDEITAIEISEAAKNVGLGGVGPLDPVRLGAFYRQNGTPIHWQFLKRPVFLHTGDLNEEWRKKAKEATAFVQSALPLKERLLRWLHLLFPRG